VGVEIFLAVVVVGVLVAIFLPSYGLMALLSQRRQRVGDDRDLSADGPRRDDPRPLHVRREPGQSVDLH